MLLYPGMGSGFIGMVFSSAINTPLYYYSLIPLFTLLSLIIVNYKEIAGAFNPKRKTTNLTDTTKQ
jgi:hypothetical protein